MSPHTGVAITLSPDFDDPGFLTQEPPCFVPCSPFLFRERGRWGVGERKDRHSVKNGSACLRSLPIRMLLKACLSITRNHTEAGCSWGQTAGSRKSRRLHMPFFSSDTHSAFAPVPQTHWRTHPVLLYTFFQLGTWTWRKTVQESHAT